MKKHILIVSQYFYPEQFRINDIALEWIERGYTVTVLTGIPNYPQGSFFDGYGLMKKKKEIWKGIQIIRIPIIPRCNKSIGLILNYLSFVVSGFFWNWFTSVKADIVFTFEVSPMTQALVGVWYAKKHRIQHYLYVQDLWPENVEAAAEIHSKIIIDSISKMVNYIYKNSDKIFATSPRFVEKIKKRVVKKSKVFYWPQYAEEFYCPNADKSVYIPQDGILNITFTGNVGIAQGLDILIKCALKLKQLDFQVRFNVVGDGRCLGNLINAAKKNQVFEYFNFVGQQPAQLIPGILAASDIAYISFNEDPLYFDTIPAKLQSYMACGMPILASAGGETKRIIDEANCGYCCNVGDVSSLCDCIVKLNKLDLCKMSFNAYAYFKLHFQKVLLMNEMDNYLNEISV